MKTIFQFTSVALHPIFMTMYVTVVYLYLFQNFLIEKELLAISIQNFVVTVIIPGTFTYLLVTIRKIDSIAIHELRQRRLPLIISTLMFVLMALKSIAATRHEPLMYFFWGCSVTSLLCLIGTFINTKVSIHMAGYTGFVGFIIGLLAFSNLMSPMLFSLLIIGIGWLATSRLGLQAHNYKEICIGILCGLVPQIYLWRYWL